MRRSTHYKYYRRLTFVSLILLTILGILACGSGGGEGNKGWIEITIPTSEDHFEVVDGNLDLVLAGWAFVSNRIYSDNSNCDNYIDVISSDCEDYVASDVWVEIINESNDTRTKIPTRSGCEQEGCSSAWSLTITLSPGINSILVVAEDSKGNRGTDRISINVVPPSSPVGVSRCTAGSCIDASGDAAFAVIDLQLLKVTVDATEISVDIGLLDIPNLLTYNSINLPDNQLEYEWRVVFDVDGDGQSSNDVHLSISNIKPPGGVEAQDALLNFTQNSVLLLNSTGSSAELIGMATATQNLSTLTITVQKSAHASLATIGTSTPFKFRAFHKIADTSYEDLFPDDDSYIN
jgi:hypothetical protein